MNRLGLLLLLAYCQGFSQARGPVSCVAAIFDRSTRWLMVGSFSCYRNCAANTFVSVHKLTEDSPKLLFINRDRGSSGHYHLALEGFQLRNGKLWPVIEFTQQAEAKMTTLLSAANDVVYANGTSLVVYHREYNDKTEKWKESCTVKAWNSKTSSYVDTPTRQLDFCDSNTGKPIKDASYLSRLPTWPLY